MLLNIFVSVGCAVSIYDSYIPTARINTLYKLAANLAKLPARKHYNNRQKRFLKNFLHKTITTH